MEFLDAFWTTMWGALAGAVVRAFAPRFFSFYLRKRELEAARQRGETPTPHRGVGVVYTG